MVSAVKKMVLYNFPGDFFSQESEIRKHGNSHFPAAMSGGPSYCLQDIQNIGIQKGLTVLRKHRMHYRVFSLKFPGAHFLHYFLNGIDGHKFLVMLHKRPRAVKTIRVADIGNSQINFEELEVFIH
jgi:hypothetical protein